MIILKKTNHIKNNKYEIQTSEVKESHLSVLKITCKGKYNWSHIFYSVYGGYAMLLEKHLIELQGKTFIAYQINEHAKGGHHEYEIQLMNLQGKVLNKFSSRYYSDYILDDKYLWFLKSGEKPFTFTSNRDLDLVKLNTSTGKVKQTMKLNYEELLNQSISYVFDIKLKIKHGIGILQINYRDKLKNSFTKRIPLAGL